MSMIIQCDGCRTRMKVPEKFAGQKKPCPKCGQTLNIPAEDPSSQAKAPPPGQTYELDEPVDEPASSRSARTHKSDEMSVEDAIFSSATYRPTDPTPHDSDDPPVKRGVGGNPNRGPSSSFAEAVIGSVKNREDEGGPRPLVTVFGIDLTRNRLIGLGAAAVLVVGFMGWWVVMGPGRQIAVARISHVSVVTALNQGDVRKPYSLLSGTGDRSLGVKGMNLRRGRGAMAGKTGGQRGSKAKGKSQTKPAHVLSLGSDHQLVVTRENPRGKYMMVEVKVSEAYMKHLNQTDRYDLDFRSHEFTLKPTRGGGKGQHPQLVFEPLDGQAKVDLSGAKCSDYKALLPPGVKPSDSQLKKRSGGVASGKVLYRGEAGVRGKVDFSSAYFASGGAPGVNGLSAKGKLTYTGTNGAMVDYQYNGPSMDVTWDQGSKGYWCRSDFNRKASDIPLSKQTVGLLFKRPRTDSSLVLTYAGRYITTLSASHRAPSMKAGGSGPKQPGRSTNSPNITKTAAGSTQGANRAADSAHHARPGGSSKPHKKLGPTNAFSSYYQVMADARDKARGVVAESNMKQLALGIQMYAQQNNGKLPNRLNDLQSVMPGYQKVMNNGHTGDNPGYVYTKPADRLDQINDPSHTSLLKESKNGRVDPNGAILYADWHIEGVE